MTVLTATFYGVYLVVFGRANAGRYLNAQR